MRIPMLFRFSLYGFLKNQQYYDPFLILAFREKGLSFFQIGLLIGFREVCINLFEIPTGAAADLYGRRRSMIFSFLAYIGSFVIFAMSRSLFLLFGAMFFFALGDAFRTGTHKAMIFDWLRLQGRSHEKTRVYGYTRSWSKMGSAVSVIIAAILVFTSGSYSRIFWFSIIPYALNIVNFLGYPAILDGERKERVSLRAVAELLLKALRQSIQYAPLRRLMVESMGFEGLFKVSKDYLQPILKQTALALPLFLSLENRQRSALLVGLVYFILHMLSSMASRRAYLVAEWRRGEEPAARFLWWMDWFLFAALVPLLWWGWYPGVIVGFISLAVIQNFWRPVQISRVNAHASPEMSATVLSIESQAKSVTTMVIAPALGWLVDRVASFWPVGAVGFVIASGILLTGRSQPSNPSREENR